MHSWSTFNCPRTTPGHKKEDCQVTDFGLVRIPEDHPVRSPAYRQETIPTREWESLSPCVKLTEVAGLDSAWRLSLPITLGIRTDFWMDSVLHTPRFKRDKLANLSLLNVKPSFSAQILPNKVWIFNSDFHTGSGS